MTKKKWAMAYPYGSYQSRYGEMYPSRGMITHVFGHHTGTAVVRYLVMHPKHQRGYFFIRRAP